MLGINDFLVEGLVEKMLEILVDETVNMVVLRSIVLLEYNGEMVEGEFVKGTRVEGKMVDEELIGGNLFDGEFIGGNLDDGEPREGNLVDGELAEGKMT